jgi:hypothetical protein
MYVGGGSFAELCRVFDLVPGMKKEIIVLGYDCEMQGQRGLKLVFGGVFRVIAKNFRDTHFQGVRRTF